MIWGSFRQFTDWVLSLMIDKPKESWYDYLIPSQDMAVLQVLMALIICGFLFLIQMMQRKVTKKWRDSDVDKKLENIRRRYKGLIVREAIFFHLNFGQDKTVPIGDLVSGTSVEKLREAIAMIETAVDKQVEFVSEMFGHIQPFIKEVTGDGVLPKDLELEDLKGLLELFALYLEKIDPIRCRRPQPGEMIYPPGIEKRIEEMKEVIEKTSELIKQQTSGNKETLDDVKRQEKIEEYKTALKEFEHVLRKRSDEYLAVINETENQSEPSLDKTTDPCSSLHTSEDLTKASKDHTPETSQEEEGEKSRLVDADPLEQADDDNDEEAEEADSKHPCLFDPDEEWSEQGDENDELEPEPQHPCLYDPVDEWSDNSSG